MYTYGQLIVNRETKSTHWKKTFGQNSARKIGYPDVHRFTVDQCLSSRITYLKKNQRPECKTSNFQVSRRERGNTIVC